MQSLEETSFASDFTTLQLKTISVLLPLTNRNPGSRADSQSIQLRSLTRISCHIQGPRSFHSNNSVHTRSVCTRNTLMQHAHAKSSGKVASVKNSARSSFTLTKRTSAAYFFSHGFTSSQPGEKPQGASTKSTWPRRLG